MAGMQGLGRVFDVVGTASTNYFSLKNASAVSFIVQSTGATSLAFTAEPSYGGTPANWTTANGFGQTGYWYQNTTHDGTGAWTKQTAVWTSNSLAVAGTSGYMSVVTVYADQAADTYDYIKVAATGSPTYVVAILHDLTVMRTPANLAILGA
jgi:hypothetical protein